MLRNGLLALVLAVAVVVPSRRHAARSTQQPSCRPLPAARGATFSFGNEAGNLRPARTDVYADGRVSTGARRLTPAVVAELARQARSGGFWALHPAPITRPPRNPDAARRFIVVRLTCGTRRTEYAGDAPPAFAALFARLDSATAAR